MNATAQEIITQDTAPQMPAVQSETSAIVSMIERAALNPLVDIDKMERLLQMQERIFERQAKAEYALAFSQMQGELPSIERNGKIIIHDKNDRNKIIQETAFATWEDINEAIKPVLKEHGFSLSFPIGQTAEGRITVTCVLLHRGGHSEQTTMVLMHDSSGSKNSVQAIGSSVSYGKRYTASAMLNITSHGEDDDGKIAGEPEYISSDQEITLRDLILAVDADEKKFCAYLKIDALSSLPSARFEAAVKALEAKRAK